MVTPSRELTNTRTGEKLTVQVVSNQPQALIITPEYVQQQKQSLALLRALVADVLVKGRDYGSCLLYTSDAADE